MQSERKFHFRNGKEELNVVIFEVVDPQYGLFTWPSATVLAQYIWHERKAVKNKEIIELGAGTALPGIVAGLCGATITLTDGEDFHNCLENCKKTCDGNGLKNVHITGLTWGVFSKTILNLPKYDIILGSDCFYDPKDAQITSHDFDDILATVAFLLERNPEGAFWTSYQVRSADWSIELLLKKWNLDCEQIPLTSFGADGENIGGTELVNNHTIQLLVITQSRTKTLKKH